MSKKNQWYEITNLEQFIDSTRVIVFDNFGKQEQVINDEFSYLLSDLSDSDRSELNKVLSHEECLIMSKDFVQQHKNKLRIDNNKFFAMIESFNNRMISNMLNNLVNQGVLESGYDVETNDFIFWIKDGDDKNEIQKPETD